jgi:flagellin
MGLRINQNIAAMNAYRNLSVTDSQMGKSLEKLSSGFRINRAADDAAGLSISEGLRAQTGGLKVAIRNAQDGVSVAQTAEGALTEVHALLQRVRDLSVQSANTGANNQSARDAAALEVNQAIEEIDRIAQSTEFNGTKLLEAGTLNFQLGANGGENDKVSIALADMTAGSGLGLKGTAATSEGAANLSTYGTAGVVDLTAGGGAGAFNLVLAKSSGETTTADIEINGNYDLNTSSGRTQLTSDLQSKLDAAGINVKAKLTTVSAPGVPDEFQLKFESDDTTDGTSLAVTGAGATALMGAPVETAAVGTGGVGTLVAAGSQDAIGRIDAAIESVSDSRAKLGAYQNRFEHAINNLNVTVENLSASESRIRDTDMAQEMVAFTRTQILSQAGTSMLAQANQAPQSVLSLLR